MKKVKMFLEFVNSNKISKHIDMTYDEIAKKLGCSVDEVEEFESYLDEIINPGKSFHGSLDDTPEDEEWTEHEMYDEIGDWEDYEHAWMINSKKVIDSKGSHDGL